jgi:hypothetical protein
MRMAVPSVLAKMDFEYDPEFFPLWVLGFLCLITILLAAILVVLLVRRNK